MTYIFSDLNVRDPFVSDSTNLLLYDTKVVVQSIWRLLNTEEGEIPNFRSYGLNLKRFSQYPLTASTADSIYRYIKDQISTYESRASIVSAKSEVDFEKGLLYFNLIIQVKSTGEQIALPTWSVQVATS